QNIQELLEAESERHKHQPKLRDLLFDRFTIKEQILSSLTKSEVLSHTKALLENLCLLSKILGESEALDVISRIEVGVKKTPERVFLEYYTSHLVSGSEIEVAPCDTR
ncbi:hypothetical protein EBR03_10435, partial [bacterium]|nr:hypothetical protein [bacterium]